MDKKLLKNFKTILIPKFSNIEEILLCVLHNPAKKELFLDYITFYESIRELKLEETYYVFIKTFTNSRVYKAWIKYCTKIDHGRRWIRSNEK